ncbi:uncharacterized protein JCM6883_002947, partial [Sporobolomyces salmoneus]|uniref:uncharacterized protein n=1 Tax=Sporobolomyces salmoneus TaxID=183962 RepID=UPI003179607A
ESTALPSELLPLLTATSATLRFLHLNIEVLLDLDYSQFPHLHTRRIGVNSHSSDEVELESDEEPILRFQRFFESLAKAPKLDTLVFDQHKLHGSYESQLWMSHHDWFNEAPTRPPLLGGLQTIRFENRISLDRVAGILGAAWARNFRRVVVPEPFFDYAGAELRAELQMDALRGLLGPRQIELVVQEY